MRPKQHLRRILTSPSLSSAPPRPAPQYRFTFATYGKGEAYLFTAKAENAAGYGEEGAAVSFTTPLSGV